MSDFFMNKSSDDWNKLKHLVDLSAENACLKAEVERLKMEESKLLTLCETYEGDLERLRKAGDAIAEALNLNDDVFDNRDKREAQAAWKAAKEGKQS